MKTDDVQKKINLVILTAFVCFVANQAMIAIYRDLNANGLGIWVYTDWLINYSTGFIRRGLAGEFILSMSEVVAPYKMAIILSWALYFSLCVSLFYLISKNIKRIPPLYLLVVLFLPSSVLFYIFDHQALGRKETLGFLFVFFHLLILQGHITKQRSLNSYIKNLGLLTFLLLPLHIFIHEASLFLFVPVHLMMSWAVFSSQSNYSNTKKITTILLCYAPILLSFLIVFLWGRPEFSQVKEMCINLEHAGALSSGICTRPSANPMFALPGALGALSWNFNEAISLSASLSKEVIFMWVMLYSLLAFITMSYLSRLSTLLSREPELEVKVEIDENENIKDEAHSALIRFKYFIFPLICTLPLFVMGWDFGRWVAIVCINFGMITLSKELGLLELRSFSRQGLILEKCAKIAGPIRLSKKSLGGFLAILLVVLCFFYLRVPHCCIKEDNFNFIAQPLQSFIQILLK